MICTKELLTYQTIVFRIIFETARPDRTCNYPGGFHGWNGREDSGFAEKMYCNAGS